LIAGNGAPGLSGHVIAFAPFIAETNLPAK